jgi:peptide/nickel transport system substrate-binding protein
MGARPTGRDGRGRGPTNRINGGSVQRIRYRARSLAVLAAISLVAAASCGGDDDDATDESASPATEAVTDETDAGADTTAAGGEDDSDAETEGEGTEPDAGEGETVEFTPGPGERHLEEDEGEPVQGGTLVYGVEADTANAWAHYRASYASSGYVALSAVSDSLFVLTEEGELSGQLVDTWEANEDYTEWTLNIREGITFHDGTPLDGAAVKFNIDACRAAPLTAGAYSPIGNVEAEGQTVTITLQGGPWVVLPAYFTGGSCGYMLSPDWLGSLPDVPQRQEGSPVYDAELAATPADGDPAAPVGVGAFVFESYTPGNGNSFVAVRNEDYWRGPNGITGEELPYLDAVEVVVAVDIESRANGLRSGQFDIIHTSNADTISQFIDDDAMETIATSRYGDTSYIMLNHASGDIDPEGTNASSPLLNVHCRRALAHAIDQQRLADERGAGLVEPANGPFPGGSIGYLEDTGYPSYDPDAALEEFDTCLSELGTDTIEFTFNTTNDPFNVESNTLIVSMWQEVFGNAVNATITPVEQGQYIGLGLVGTFNALAWRSHSGTDPDQQRLWWHSASASPVGELALNFGRFRDADIDAALETIKTNPDPEARRAAAEDVNRAFGEQVYNWWLTTTLWSVIEQPYVNGVEGAITIDGEPATGLVGAGRHNMNQLWCDEGACE